MKIKAFNYFKLLTADRPLLLLSLLIIGLLTVFGVYVGIVISPSEVQLATRYSAFGEVHFYRNQWVYLLNFIGFAAVIAVVHVGLMSKMLERDMRTLALAFGWLTVILVVTAFIVTRSVLGIAYLS